MQSDNSRIDLIAGFTDFGLTGPYLGQMAAVLAVQAPHTPYVTLMADAPMFDPASAGILLSHLCTDLPPATLILAVVDPGVGSDRHPIMVKTARHLLVGPDNGLLVPMLRASANCTVETIAWRPERLSASFHGRDLFAPVAARLANGEAVEGEPLMPHAMVGFDAPLEHNRIIYIDHFGNALTGIEAMQIEDDRTFRINGAKLGFARTFSEVPAGRAFWYRNSIGLVEFAVNRGSASRLLHLTTGMPVDP